MRSEIITPSRKQVEWQAEAYQLLDSLPYSYGDLHMTLAEDEVGDEDLRVSVQFWAFHVPAGRWNGTIQELRHFARAIQGVKK